MVIGARSWKLAAIPAVACAITFATLNFALVAPAHAFTPSAGGPVLVPELTTPTQQVWNNADGTQTAELSAVPVRVNKGGAWKDIDTTLVTSADGLLRPSATLADVAVSAGGSAPLVSLRRGATQFDLTWPTTLPAPSVAANVATYADVAPGVDLRVTALPDGVSEVLVVKSAAASKNPLVRSLSLGTKVSGGAISANAVGGFDLRDGAGALMFRNGSATLWDAAALTSPERAQLAAEQAITGVLPDGVPAADVVRAHPPQSHRGDVDVRVGGSSLTLTPDTSLLDSSSTQYPVVIDPSLTPSTTSAWGMVSSAFPSTTYYKWSTADEGVGYSDFQSPVMTKRLYYAFGTSALAGTYIKTAQFSATETWSSACVAREIDLWRTGVLKSTTSWSTMPGWSSKVASATVAHGNPACSTSGSTITPGDYSVEFNAKSAVQAIADGKLSSATFGLRAASESDDFAWKRFKADGRLTVTYDHYPNRPTSMNLVTPSGAAIGCGSSTSPVPINTTQFYARGSFTDADSGDQLQATFKYWSVSTGTLISIRYVGPQAQGQFTTPLWGGMDTGQWGTVYRWQAYSHDTDGQVSATGPGDTTFCYFRIDTTAPSAPQATVNLSGTNTPPNANGDPITGIDAGTALSFTFKPGGTAADTYRYRWSVNSDTPGPELLPSTATSGAMVTKAITLKAAGPTTVRVWAYDQVGNQSAALQFPFVTRGAVPVRWSLDNTTSPAAADTACVPTGSGPAATGLTWATGVASSTGNFGKALTFTSGSASSTGSSPIAATDTQQNPAATLTSWVHIDPAALSASPFVNRTVFSVDGATGTALSVGIALDGSGAPRLMAQLTNTSGKPPTTVFDTTELSNDDWYDVAVSVDYDSEQLQLVVDTQDAFGANPGVSISTSWHNDNSITAVQLTGLQRLGTSRSSSGALTGQWLGQVDEVRTFRAAFTADDGLSGSSLRQWLNTVPNSQGGIC